jgi:predicted XRE-type DNA-binding protein
MKPNQEIRNMIFSSRIRNYEVAEKVGISDTRFSVWLRTELSDERKQRVLNAIDELKKQMA